VVNEMPVDINTPEYLDFLFRTGHFWNPKYPNTNNVQQSDLPSLSSNIPHWHNLVQQATASWQSSDANFDVLSFITHLRGIIADGDVGPVTAMMSTVPRCPLPDFPPPPGAAVPQYSDDPAMQRTFEEIVESMMEFATGSGSWPVPGCDVTRPDRNSEHSVRVGLNTANCPSGIKAYLDDSILLTRKCAAEMGLAARFVTDGGDSEFAVQWENIPGSVIGYCYFPQGQTCQQVVKARLDTGYDAGAQMLATLMTHEFLGHGVGLEHTRGGIMNPSILRINPLTWKGDPHESTYRRYFGGEPVPIDDDPSPPGPIPPGEPYNGVFTVDGKLYKIKVFS